MDILRDTSTLALKLLKLARPKNVVMLDGAFTSLPAPFFSDAASALAYARTLVVSASDRIIIEAGYDSTGAVYDMAAAGYGSQVADAQIYVYSIPDAVELFRFRQPSIQDVVFALEPSIEGLAAFRAEAAGTFSRASTATYIDDNGVVQTVSSGVHRIQDGGLLMEAGVTNQWTYSEDLNNAVWVKTGATVTADATAAPDNNVTADKLVEDTSNGTHELSRDMVGATDGLKQGVSFFAAPAGRSKIEVVTRDKDGVTEHVSRVNVSTGTVELEDSSHDIYLRSAANGFYRVQVVAAVGSGASAPRLTVRLHDGTSSTYAGDGSSGIYLWGMQDEADSAWVTSYIPTTTATVTRQADVLTYPLTRTLGQGLTVQIDFIPLALDRNTDPFSPVVAIGQADYSGTHGQWFGLRMTNSSPASYVWVVAPIDTGAWVMTGLSGLALGTAAETTIQVSATSQSAYQGDTLLGTASQTLDSTAGFHNSVIRISPSAPAIVRRVTVAAGIKTPSQMRGLARS